MFSSLAFKVTTKYRGCTGLRLCLSQWSVALWSFHGISSWLGVIFFFFFCAGCGAEAIYLFLPIIFSCGFGSMEIFSTQCKLEEFMESVLCSWTICPGDKQHQRKDEIDAVPELSHLSAIIGWSEPHWVVMALHFCLWQGAQARSLLLLGHPACAVTDVCVSVCGVHMGIDYSGGRKRLLFSFSSSSSYAVRIWKKSHVERLCWLFSAFTPLWVEVIELCLHMLKLLRSLFNSL